MPIKISTLELENVKRIKAVQLAPAENGLTVIGGKNRQGKTSVLDAIAWVLGGDRFKPSNPCRDGSVIPPHLRVTLSNGLVVERSGDKGSLKVIDPSGNKGGQQLLNSFVEQLAINLPRFLDASAKEKADTLLRIIGVGDKLYQLETQEQSEYNKRHAIGQIADQKEKHAKEMPVYAGVPAEPVSVSELIQQQQDILARNGENRRKRDNCILIHAEMDNLASQVERLREELERQTALLAKAEEDYRIACRTVEDLTDESTAELEASIAGIEELNAKVRANLDREKAEIDAEEYKAQYQELTAEIERIRQEKLDLLKGADLPLEGLTVEDGELLYNGYKWDSISGSDQLIVATSIVRKLNPECGFVLLDKLEQMDTDTLSAFGDWLEAQGLQAIATRVSTGNECSIIIEDGISKEVEAAEPVAQKPWKEGEF